MRRRWKAESNPAIPWYFAFTDESPCNDSQLDWCAAFVSWALVSSGRQRLPYADVAGDMLALKKHAYADIKQVKVGDLILFSRAGGGHIGFFSAWEGKEKARVLGGNQSDGTPDGSSSICEQVIRFGDGMSTKLAMIIPVDAFKTIDRDRPTPHVIDGSPHLVFDDAGGPWPSI